MLNLNEREGIGTYPVVPERLEATLDALGDVNAANDEPEDEDGERNEEKAPLEDHAILEECQ